MTTQGTRELGHPSCSWYISHQRNSGYKTEQGKHWGTKSVHFLPWSLSVSPYTRLSRVGSDQATGMLAGRVCCEKKEVVQQLHYTHIIRLARWCCATPTFFHPWGRALDQPMRQASALACEEARASLFFPICS